MATDRAYQKAYMAERYATRRAMLNELKSVPCAHCGGSFPPYVMDFHHRDPEEKLFSIGATMISHKLSVLMAEVAKCDVVCANCHRIIEHQGE
jgi:hypothetical protein